ncbi:MAG TPA: FecR domain-containing protein, partial [Dehalococcoidia bacterium]|nr:FecR domain-containing protein [Dehalococcoidia bacterium]
MNRSRTIWLAGAGVAAVIAIAVGAYLVLATGSSVHAGSTILSVISGDVQVQNSGEAAPHQAVDGQEMLQGDRIITARDGRAVVTFFDGSTQTIEPGSDITLEKLSSNSKGGLSAEVRQDKGTTWNNVLRPEGSVSDFKVSTPAAVGAVRDTSFLVTVDLDGKTEFWSRLGTVDVQSAGESVAVGPGTSSITDPGGAPGEPQPKPRADSEVQMELASSAWLLVVDPNGYAAGIYPPGVPVNQIPLTLITDYTQEPQKVYMLDLMQGSYQVYLVGKNTGDFHLTAVGSTHGTAVAKQEIDG